MNKFRFFIIAVLLLVPLSALHAADVPLVTLGGEVGAADKASLNRFSCAPYDSLAWIRADLTGEKASESDDAGWGHLLFRPFKNYSGDISGRFIEIMAMNARGDYHVHPAFKQLLADAQKQQRPGGYFATGGLIDWQQPIDYKDIYTSTMMPALWGNARLLCGLVEASRSFPKDAPLLATARRLGDFYVGMIPRLTDPARMCEYKGGDTYAAGYVTCYFPAMEGLAKLHALTGEKKYLEAAVTMAAFYKQFDRVPIDHAHGMLCNQVSLVLLYEATRDVSYLERVEKRWEELVTGGYINPAGGIMEQCKVKFGRDEGCAIADWLRLNLALGRVTGKTRYWAMAERTLHNHFLQNQTPKGGFGHRSSLCDEEGVYGFSDSIEEAVWCCTFHGQLGFVNLRSHLLTRTAGELTCHFAVDFIAKYADGAVVSDRRPVAAAGEVLRQRIRLDGLPATVLRVRQPHWADAVTAVAADGSALGLETRDGYCLTTQPVSEATFIYAGGLYAEDRHCKRLPAGPVAGAAGVIGYGPQLLAAQGRTAAVPTWPTTLEALKAQGLEPFTAALRDKQCCFVNGALSLAVSAKPVSGTSPTASGVASGQTTSPLLTRADDLAGNFPSPPHSARTGMYWFWINGNITREGITADLEAMARVGIRTVLLFETSGEIPEGPVRFLSDEWRALFRHALDEADRLGMKLNINNDAGWCGSGGPWNTPEHSMQQLVSTRTSVEGGKPFDAVLPQPPAVKGFYRDILVLATKAAPAGDDPKQIWPRSQAVDLTSTTDASGRLRWDPPAGTWDVLRIGHTSTGKDNHPSPASGCGPECDKLSKTAVKAHFDGMMSKLITDAGPLAGKTLEYTHIDSWEVGTQNWTPAFREEFQRLRGYDPLPFLPGELGYIVDDAETNRRFQWDMRVTVSDLILENYAGYFRELAAAHGLKLSVEAYGAHPGHCPANNLAYAGRADMPMGEFWVGHDNYRSCKEMACASHVYGKRLTGAEAFTAWPDNARRQYHPGNLKAMGDAAFCVGINRLVLSFYTHQPWLDRAPGMTMQGWGTHFDRTETWWEQSKAWNTYLARCQHLLQSGLFAADVCYLDVEDAPRDAPYPVNLPGYDYDVCPAEVVKNRMSVKDGRVTLPDGMSYRLLVLPPTDRMTPETLRSVVALAKAGAAIAATTLPSQSPSLQNHPWCDAEVKALARELFGEIVAAPGTGIRESRCGAGKVILGGDVTQALAALGIQPDITFANAGKADGFRWIHRRTDTADFYFLSNQLAEEKQVTCTFRAAGAQPELWHPETGRIARLPVYKSTADGRIEVPLKFGPAEAFFVVFPKSRTAVASAGTHSGNWPEFQPAMTVAGPWQVTFDPKWGGPQKPVVFETLTDWSRHVTDGVRFYSGTAVYQKTFAVDPSVAGLPSVFLDLGQVEVAAEVKLNGQPLGTLWKSPYRLEVTGLLKPGDHQLEIRVVNLWCNRLIGDEQLPEDVEWKDGFMGWGGQFDLISRWPQWLLDGKPSPGGRFTFSTASYYKKEDALKPSGLLGPIRLLMAR